MSLLAGITELAGKKWAAPQNMPLLQGRYRRVWLDTETTGKNPYADQPVGISGYTEDGKGWYLPWGHAGGGNLDPKKIREWARTELRDLDLTFINAKFDNHMLYRWGVDLEAQGCRLHDVAFPAALLDERRRRFNLNDLCLDVLGRKKSEGVWADEKAHIAELPAATVGPYAEQDAIDVHDLDVALRTGEGSRLSNNIAGDDLGRVLDLEDACIFAVCEMERNGAHIDRPKLERWIKEVETKYHQTMMEIARRAGFRVNPDSALDMTKLFAQLGIKPPTTVTGADSFEGDYLRGIKNETVQLCMIARECASLLSKYLKKYLHALDGNNILRYSLHQLRGDEKGTVSGRFSCASPGADIPGANIQQVMRVNKQKKRAVSDWIIRELFIPAEGKTWLSADAAQIEFRLFVHYSASERLIARYTADPNVDFHNVVLDMMRRVHPDFERDKAKTINFAKIYGGGRQAIADQMGVDRNESDPFVDLYEAEFPEAGRLLRKATRLAETRTYVMTVLGRRARFQKPSSDDKRIRMLQEMAYKPHSALNRVLQGGAGDVLKKKIVEVHNNRKTLEITERMTVHDEFDADIEDPGKAKMMEELLNEQAFPFRVPILWEVSTGRNWAEAK